VVADGRTLGGRLRWTGAAVERRRWQTRSDAFVVTLGRSRRSAFSPDGSVLASAGEDHTIWLWDAATGKERVPVTGHRGSVAAALSPDGKVIATVGQDGGLWLWEADTGKEIERMRARDP